MRCALRSGVRTPQRIGGVQVLECGARRDRRRSREALGSGDLRADVEYDCTVRPEQLGGCLDRSVSVVGAVVADENGRLFHGRSSYGQRLSTGTVNEYHSKRHGDVATATPLRNKNVTRQAVDPDYGVDGERQGTQRESPGGRSSGAGNIRRRGTACRASPSPLPG